jgi:hypothetical protein
MTKQKFCGNCDQYVTPTKGASLIITFILLCFAILPGVAYWMLAHRGSGRCPLCGSKNWVKR